MPPKKAKGVKVSLAAFLNEGAEPAVETPLEEYNEHRDEPAPYAAQPVFDIADLPPNGPFKAYVGNLAFSSERADIEDFFGQAGLKAIDVQIPRDRETDRMKGFAIVQFDSRDELQAAIDLNGSELKGRSLKINVQKPRENAPGQRKTFDRSDRPERVVPASRADDDSNWRTGAAPPAAATPSRGDSDRPERSAYGGRGGYGDREGGRGGYERTDRDGFERQGGRGGYGDREGGRGGYERTDRDGFERQGGRGGYDRGYGDRDGGRGGYDRSNGDRDGGRGGYGDRDGGRGGYGDRDGGRGGYRGGERRGYGGEEGGWRSGAPSHEGTPQRDAGPAERPKLNLAKRGSSNSNEAEGSSAASTPAKSNPFGNAKPVDTAKKLEEVEAKLAQVTLPKGEDAEESAKPVEAAAPAPASAPARKSNPFGNARPVDTKGSERHGRDNKKPEPAAAAQPSAASKKKDGAKAAANTFAGLEVEDD